MRQILRLFSILLFLAASVLHGQYSIQISTDPEHTTLDFAQISIKKNAQGISGQKEFFRMNISKPIPTEQVRLYGEISWQDVDKNSPELMAKFLTAPFTATYLTNTQFGNMIQVDDDWSDGAVVDRNIAKGKLVGKYFLQFKLYSALAPNRISRLNLAIPLAISDLASFEVKNPTQTISIMEPMTGDVKLVDDNISIGWTQVDGITGFGNGANASYYRIKANRILTGETADDALGKSSLYVDKKLSNLSGQTNVSWQLIKNKDWSPGDNIVVVVSAVFADGTELKSAPVFFSVASNTTAGGDTSHTRSQFNLQEHPLNLALVNALNNLPASLLANIPAGFLQSLTNGTLVLNSITVDGVTFTPEQMQILMAQLIANPSLILSIALNRK